MLKGEADSIFSALDSSLELIDIYDGLSKHSRILEYYFDNFGQFNGYYINKEISINLSKDRGWKATIYINNTPIEDTMFKPHHEAKYVVKDLKDLKNLLKNWVDNNYDTNLLDKSLFISILKELNPNDDRLKPHCKLCKKILTNKEGILCILCGESFCSQCINQHKQLCKFSFQ